MDNQTEALKNIDRAINKAKRFGETPSINTLNMDSCQGLTLEQVKQEIANGNSYHVKVWSKSEAEVKAAISKITNR